MISQTPQPPARRTRRSVAGATCAIAAVAALAGSAPATAAAATPAIDTSTLNSVLGSTPGVNDAQIRALDADLAALAAGNAPATLTGDVESLIETLLAPYGIAPVTPPVAVPGTSDVEQLIQQLNDDAEQTGIPGATANAINALATFLTTADLPSLLGQGTGPLSSSAINAVMDELKALQGLAPGQSIPAGALSDVASALDTIASQPGVPAGVASVLQDVAGTLGSASALPAQALQSAAAALEGTVPSLNAVPGAGPSLGSAVGAVATELAATPAAGGSGTGAAPGGGSAAQPASGSSATQPASASVQSAHIKAGARIRSVAYKHGKLKVRLTCSPLVKGNCTTAINVAVGSWHAKVKKVTIRPGVTRTITTRIPSLATVARHRKVAVAVTATTGSFTTHKHTVHIRPGK